MSDTKDDAPFVIRLGPKRNQPQLDAFMKEFSEKAWHLHGNFYIWEEKVMFELRPFDGKIHLSAIQCPVESKQGHASRALDWMLRLADKHGVGVEGSIKRLGSDGLTYGQLRSWYARHGFKIERNTQLSYEPKL